MHEFSPAKKAIANTVPVRENEIGRGPAVRIVRDEDLLQSPPKPTPDRVELPYQPFGAYRFFLAVLVVVSHSAVLGGVKIYALVGPWGLGNIAVMVFFVLSGYIIAEALESFYSGRTLSFLTNRALRIVPPYLAALVASAVIHYWLQSTGRIAFIDYNSPPPGMFTEKNLVANVFIVGWLYQVGVFSFDPTYLFVRYLWAVRVEVHFYVVAAVIYAWQRRILLRLAFFFVVSWWMLSFVTGHGQLYYLAFAPHFLLGMSLRYINKGYSLAKFAAFISFGLAVLHFSTYIGKNKQALIVAPAILYSVLALAIIFLARVRISSRLRRSDRWLGDLSYPLYLNHYVITIAVVTLAPQRTIWTFLACLPLSIVASWLIANLTEPVTRKLRNRIRGVALA